MPNPKLTTLTIDQTARDISGDMTKTEILTALGYEELTLSLTEGSQTSEFSVLMDKQSKKRVVLTAGANGVWSGKSSSTTPLTFVSGNLPNDSETGYLTICDLVVDGVPQGTKTEIVTWRTGGAFGFNIQLGTSNLTVEELYGAYICTLDNGGGSERVSYSALIYEVVDTTTHGSVILNATFNVDGDSADVIEEIPVYWNDTLKYTLDFNGVRYIGTYSPNTNGVLFDFADMGAYIQVPSESNGNIVTIQSLSLDYDYGTPAQGVSVTGLQTPFTLMLEKIERNTFSISVTDSERNTTIKSVNGVPNILTEQESGYVWRYRLYDNGFFEAWGTFKKQLAITNQDGNVYISQSQNDPLPVGIHNAHGIDIFTANVSVENGFYPMWASVHGSQNDIRYYVVSGDRRTVSDCTIRIYVAGTTGEPQA